MKEYIKKAIETESGFNAECWVATGVWIDLKENVAVISLDGYKDFAAKEAGKEKMGTITVNIPDLTVLPCYSSTRTDIISAMLGSETLSGATLEQVEE